MHSAASCSEVGHLVIEEPRAEFSEALGLGGFAFELAAVLENHGLCKVPYF